MICLVVGRLSQLPVPRKLLLTFIRRSLGPAAMQTAGTPKLTRPEPHLSGEVSEVPMARCTGQSRVNAHRWPEAQHTQLQCPGTSDVS